MSQKNIKLIKKGIQFAGHSHGLKYLYKQAKRELKGMDWREKAKRFKELREIIYG